MTNQTPSISTSNSQNRSSSTHMPSSIAAVSFSNYSSELSNGHYPQTDSKPNPPSSQDLNQGQKLKSSSLRRLLLKTILPTLLVPLAITHIIGYKLLQYQNSNQMKQQLKSQSLLVSREITNINRNGQDADKLAVSRNTASQNSSETSVYANNIQISEYLQQMGLKDSQQVQLINASTGRVGSTITAQGPNDTRDVVGGQSVKDIAAALVKARQEPLDADQIARLKQQYALQDLTVMQSSPEQDIKTLTTLFTHQSKQYALSTTPETDWVAVASIDQSEADVVNVTMLVVLTLTFLGLSGSVGAAILYFARQLSTPLRYLTGTAEQAAMGNLDVLVMPHGSQEVQNLAQTLNTLIFRIKGFVHEQSTAVKQARLLSDISSARTLNEQDVEHVFNQALDGTCQLLGVDRMVVYRFKSDWSGYVSHESVVSNWTRALNNEIEDACIPQVLLEGYQRDRVVPTSDVFNAGFHPDHLKLMERLQIKANLVVPILHEGQLFGLLIAHHCAKTHEWREAEISFMRQLAAQLGVTLDRLAFIQERELQVERSHLLRDITLQITQPNTSEAVLAQLPLVQIRQVLKADRIIIYRFDEYWNGTVTAESVDNRFPRALGAEIHDPCFEKDYVEKYKRGRIQATSNIHEAGLTQCHLNQLEPFAVKANLVAPIIQGEQLLGLLIAHQCSAPRQWQQLEIDIFAQIANQVALALDRCDLLKQKETAAQQSSLLADEQRQQKETLQRQLTNLLAQVEEVTQGDLTVRADVTTGEIGTVADFFNSVVESLRQIVTNVKQSAFQVSHAIGEDETAIRQLADIALKQAEETTHTLYSVEQMTHSIQVVADNARQAAAVASTASSTAAGSSMAMDLTVESIQNLRGLIGDTSKKLKRLSESSQQISKVASLIEKIALQTNLLSINAGIEAARAGQEGQGFAVLAEEIGELAAKSAAATREVEDIVSTIQMETNQVVEAMEESTAKVVEGTRLVEDTKQSLSQILEVLTQIDQLVNSISAATISQTETSQVVTALMKEVAHVSQQTSHSSNKVSTSLQRTVEVAQELQASVSAFKVEV